MVDAPAVEGGVRGRDRVVDVGLARPGRRSVGLPGARVDERRRGAVPSVDRLAVHHVLHDFHRDPSRTIASREASIRRSDPYICKKIVVAQVSDDEIRTPEIRTPAPLLDDVSMQIIRELQHDGRRPYTSIAKTIGLSEAAVRQRVQRLLDAGVMQIVAVTDPLRVGLHRQAMVGIKVDGDVRDLAAKLTANKEIDYVVICSGAYDLLVELTARDDEHLLEVINTQIRSIPGVRSTEMFVYLRLEKQTYSWGT